MKISSGQISIRQPDDWHLHLRDGSILKEIVPHTARVFGRAIVMPNLQSPITTVESAKKYRQRIIEALPRGVDFTPLMTAYLTDDLSPNVLERGKKEGVFTAAKLYPANATTNSANGVSDINRIDKLLETMQRIQLPLLIHGEVVDPDVDIYDREAIFIDRYLKTLLSRYPELRIVLEHITTEDAVQFVLSSGPNLAATITPHHLHINRNAIFQEGLRSDFYCLPVAKREKHRLALREAATSGNPSFFLGSDSAPHTRFYKENACSCAGIFNATFALESYVDVFDNEGCLSQLENFTSVFGPTFYGLPINNKFITLIREKHLVPLSFEFKEEDQSIQKIIPFHAGEYLNWSILKSEK